MGQMAVRIGFLLSDLMKNIRLVSWVMVIFTDIYTNLWYLQFMITSVCGLPGCTCWMIDIFLQTYSNLYQAQ